MNLDLGIDLGTSSVLIYAKNKGIVLNEPSIIAVKARNGELIASGKKAYNILGKNPDTIRTIQPLKDGVISDYEAAHKMIRSFMQQIMKTRIVRPRVAICIPTNATEVEVLAVGDAAQNMGARKPVYIIEEPLAAIIGCGIDISKPNGNLIIDIGGGTADIAVISLASKVISKSVKLGGANLSERIKKYIQRSHSTLMGDKMIENLKYAIADCDEHAPNEVFVAKGRNLLNGLPQVCRITRGELVPVVQGYADQIYRAVKEVLESTPPELTSDIYSNGAVMTGGGSILSGLAGYLQDQLGFPVRVADHPVDCVAIGAGTCFKYQDCLGDGFSTLDTYMDKKY